MNERIELKDLKEPESINVIEFSFLNSVDFRTKAKYSSEISNLLQDTAYDQWKLSVEKLRQYIHIDLDVKTITDTGFEYYESFPYRLCTKQDFIIYGLPS